MNNHLNIFKTYSSTNREHQLENDLTRALAICFQEDSLFFHKILEDMFKNTFYYEKLFGSINADTSLTIDIQKQADKLNGYEHIFAVSLSESKMADFWEQDYSKKYNPVCDIVIAINEVLIIIEAKRNNENCTAQLHNQIMNIIRHNDEFKDKTFNKDNFEKIVTPYDLNWTDLMSVATKVLSFEQATNNKNRFLSDFVKLVRKHNYRWLPEPAISSLQPEDTRSITRRIESTLEQTSEHSHSIERIEYNDRIGLVFPKAWAQEIVFNINKDGNLILSTYPGNTKGQGYSLFKKAPKFNTFLSIKGTEYPVVKKLHIVFTSFQRYFASISFTEENLKKELYTKSNFSKFTGRKKRVEHWDSLEQLFDLSFNDEFDWRTECRWSAIRASGKSQFDISFGYYVATCIPFKTLKELDQSHDDLTNLVELTESIFEAFSSHLLIE